MLTATMQPRNPGEQLRVAETVLKRRDFNIREKASRAKKIRELKRAHVARPPSEVVTANKFAKASRISKADRLRQQRISKKVRDIERSMLRNPRANNPEMVEAIKQSQALRQCGGESAIGSHRVGEVKFKTALERAAPAVREATLGRFRQRKTMQKVPTLIVVRNSRPIRSKGGKHTTRTTADAVAALRLTSPHSAIFVPDTLGNREKLMLAGPFVFYGRPDEQTVDALLFRRGKIELSPQLAAQRGLESPVVTLNDNVVIEELFGLSHDILCVQDLVAALSSGAKEGPLDTLCLSLQPFDVGGFTDNASKGFKNLEKDLPSGCVGDAVNLRIAQLLGAEKKTVMSTDMLECDKKKKKLPWR